MTLFDIALRASLIAASAVFLVAFIKTFLEIIRGSKG